MSGFQYQCDTCRRITGDVHGRGNGSLCGVDGCFGRLRLSREWLGQGKNFGQPGAEKKEGGRGPLDPTGPIVRDEKDETLPVDISGKNGEFVVGNGTGEASELESVKSQDGSGSVFTIDDLPEGLQVEEDRHEVGTEDDLGQDLEVEEAAIDAYVTVARKSNVSRKIIRTWKRMGHLPVTTQCFRCRQTCVLAQSTAKVIEDALERGQRYEPVCGECQEELGVEEASGGIVAEQAKELLEVQRRVLGAEVRGRKN